MMCQCRFISCHKRTTLEGVMIMEEAVHVWGQGINEQSLYLLLHFVVSLKLLLKIKSLKNVLN